MLSELFRGEARCRIDCEEILPDYKDDINRIICVDAKPKIVSKRQYFESPYYIFELEGTTAFNVIYQTGADTPFTAHTFYEDFNHTFKVPIDDPDSADLENVASFVSLSGDPSSCRPLSPRKLSLKANIDISIALKCNRRIAFYGNEEDELIEKKTEAVSITALKSVYRKEYTISEQLCLPKEYLPCGEILDCDADLICLSSKRADGKILINGLANICCAYQSEASDAEPSRCISFSQPIEFSESLEADLLSENDLFDIQLDVTSLKAESDIDSYGETRIIKTELCFSAESNVYFSEEISVLTDCFSVTKELSIEKEDKKYERLVSIFTASSEIRDSFDPPAENLESCEDIKASIEFTKSSPKDDGFVIDGKLNIRYIGISSDGSSDHFTHSQPFTLPLRQDRMTSLGDYESLRIELDGAVKGIDIDPTGRMNMRADLNITSKIYAKNSLNAVGNISAVGDKSLTPRAPIVLYYPSADESVWDIAKLYSIPVSKLIADNELEGNSLPEIIKIL